MLLSTRIVTKEEQPAFALEEFGIADLSALPADWNPGTHYVHGRPLTPQWPNLVDARSEHWTEGGAWIVKTFAPPPPTTTTTTGVLLCLGDNLLVFDDPQSNFTVALKEKKVGDIPIKHLPHILAKLIRKVGDLRRENARLQKKLAPAAV
jgi:hypothetical protein